MAHRIIVGSLAPQNWHRQARHLPAERRFDFVYGKTVAIARRFGFSPMGIDFGLAGLPTTDRAYLEELRARMQADGIVPAVGLGGMRLNGVAVGDGLVDFERVLPLLVRAPVEELIFSMEVDTDDRDEDEMAERSYTYLAAWLTKHGYR
jgi:hypothetical protein